MFIKKSVTLFLVCFSLLGFPGGLSAIDLQTAANQVAEYFEKSAVKLEANTGIYFQVVNRFSNKEDRLSEKIETELYFALEKQFSGYRLYLDSSQNAGIMVLGTYEPKGNVIHLRLQAFDRKLDGEILAQTEVSFTAEKEIGKKLVVVLDLEAETLSKTQRKAFSDVFRSALFRKKAFDLVSSAEVDKFNPEQIQQQSGCTRDECAIVIGEQLGVDRVISSSMHKVNNNLFILSGKMIDIKDGSVLAATTVKHNGQLIILDRALETLAVKLTSDKPEIQEVATIMERPAINRELKEKTWLTAERGYHIAVISAGAIFAIASRLEAAKINKVKSDNNEIAALYKQTADAQVRISLKAQYDSNMNEINDLHSNIRYFDLVTVICIGVEAYRLSQAFSKADKNKGEKTSFQPFLGPASTANRSFTVGLLWRW